VIGKGRWMDKKREGEKRKDRILDELEWGGTNGRVVREAR
jgi:hypothetical protein